MRGGPKEARHLLSKVSLAQRKDLHSNPALASLSRRKRLMSKVGIMMPASKKKSEVCSIKLHQVLMKCPAESLG